MRIAILGASSQIAKDLIRSFAKACQHELILFARKPELVTQWLARTGLGASCAVSEYESFGSGAHYDAIINFVGVGNPAQAAAMGASIFDVTLQYDEMALGYVRNHPSCKYVFLSSGAALGAGFDAPADAASKAMFAINNLQPQDWYGVAKLHAECRHRADQALPIVDVRVFNYFSETQDFSARFLISDILRAIKNRETLLISPDNISRDYMGAEDFHQLIAKILAAPPRNDVVDCYTKAPVEKMALLAAMQEHFGLQFEIKGAQAGINATGMKWNYFSVNRQARIFGFDPVYSSLDVVLGVSRQLLQANKD